jgi:LPXTG-motif cell wall-anchored protein
LEENNRGNMTTDRTQARRVFLKRAATAGTVVWAAPTILTMSAASAAQLQSNPPRPPDLEARRETPPGPAAQATADQVAAARTGTLPRTGADIDKLTAAGLTAAAGGGALLWWSSELEKRAGDVPPVATD